MSFSINDMYEGATEPTAGLIFIGPGTHLLTLAEFKPSIPVAHRLVDRGHRNRCDSVHPSIGSSLRCTSLLYPSKRTWRRWGVHSRL